MATTTCEASEAAADAVEIAGFEPNVPGLVEERFHSLALRACETIGERR